MQIPDTSNYLKNWKYTEFGHYDNSSNKLIREMNPALHDINDFQSYIDKYNNIGVYTSIWLYDDLDFANNVRYASLYFDLDSKEEDDLSLSDARYLVEHLMRNLSEEDIVIYFTGAKGFHIECEAFNLGINPDNNLHNLYRFIASDIGLNLELATLDFSVYDARRMWRYPGSIHQKTGLYKTKLTIDFLMSHSMEQIKDYSSIEHNIEYPSPNFNHKANEWFRDYSYKFECNSMVRSDVDILEAFSKYGTSIVYSDLDDYERIFDADGLLSNCEGIAKLIEQVQSTGELEHEARLFLCSILSYNDEAISFLIDILSNTKDFNIHKTMSHINDWTRRRELGIGGRPFSCERAKAAGVGCSNCQLEPKEKVVKVGGKYMETGESSLPSPIRFAYKYSLKEKDLQIEKDAF